MVESEGKVGSDPSSIASDGDAIVLIPHTLEKNDLGGETAGDRMISISPSPRMS
jgi:hypothetical protein